MVTMTTEPLDKGAWAVSPRVEYYRSRPLSYSKLLESPDFESISATHYNYLTVGYGVTDNWYVGTAMASQKIFNINSTVLNEYDFLEVANRGSPSGISDTNFFSVLRLNEQTKRIPFSSAVLFGLSTPTGITSLRTKQGDLFAASDQPGTGSWQPSAALILTTQRKKMTLSSTFYYSHGTKGAQGVTLGSYFDYSVAAVYPLISEGRVQTEGILEMNGEYATKNRAKHITDPNSGGNSIFITPGLRANLGKKISLYFGLGIPVVDNLFGTQSKSAYEILCGIDFSF